MMGSHLSLLGLLGILFSRLIETEPFAMREGMAKGVFVFLK